MATLFDTSTDNISLHLKNIYDVAELEESATTEDFSLVQEEGIRRVRRRIKHYNLDAVISVGYRVSSARATQFRQWATRLLNQHLLARPVEQLFNDNTLVALALLVAESLPPQKELMVRLIEHFVLLKADIS